MAISLSMCHYDKLTYLVHSCDHRGQIENILSGSLMVKQNIAILCSSYQREVIVEFVKFIESICA
jgi:hypothetical protein